MNMNLNNKKFHIVSPLIESEALSRLLSDETHKTNVYLKLDNNQPSGSFKIRGIGHLINQVCFI
jgi:L-serine/L-threonine ammonia-lyase